MDSSGVSCISVCLPVTVCTYIVQYHVKQTYIIQYKKVITLTIKIYIFSASEIKTISYTLSERDALAQLGLVRTWKQMPEFSLLFRRELELHWGNDRQVERKEKLVSQHSISQHIAGRLPSRWSQTFDQRYMESFLKRTSLNDPTFNGARYSR